ncbi:monooxygenase [Coemansia biformis]|uniref:Monooxygenase n=1 Tax=Coemansia biformis TaxID=1286918 RepID=A0A9W7Y9J6_9FUNG|nr:monooxygenase [Coemansia biformis]
MKAETAGAVRPTDPFEVVEYDPAWATQFADEQAQLRQALGGLVEDIEHVGSTSIPGLAAKPIIDIQLVVSDFSNLAECVEKMQSLGYVYLGLSGIEGREYFVKHRVHTHMVQRGNDEYMRKRLFLQYLRNNEQARSEYSELKKRLAAEWAGHPDCQNRYNIDKTEFIMGALGNAGWDTSRKPLYLRQLENGTHEPQTSSGISREH